MAKINYPNKLKTASDGTQLFTDADANEIKASVNAVYDDGSAVINHTPVADTAAVPTTAGLLSTYLNRLYNWIIEQLATKSATGHTHTKTDVGLGNVDNTSDAAKPISTATQTALDAKEPTLTGGTAAQYFKGDKTLGTLDKTAVGLGNVDNTSDANKPVSTAQQTALDGKAAASHTHALGDGTTAGFSLNDFTAALKTKLDGIAAGATANDTDANLKARANHTGTQAASTITGLATVATSGAFTDLTGTASVIQKESTSPAALAKVWGGTQAQYDAIGTKDAATLYFIS